MSNHKWYWIAPTFPFFPLFLFIHSFIYLFLTPADQLLFPKFICCKQGCWKLNCYLFSIVTFFFPDRVHMHYLSSWETAQNRRIFLDLLTSWNSGIFQEKVAVMVEYSIRKKASQFLTMELVLVFSFLFWFLWHHEWCLCGISAKQTVYHHRHILAKCSVLIFIFFLGT